MAHHMDMVDVVVIALGSVLVIFVLSALVGLLADYLLED